MPKFLYPIAALLLLGGCTTSPSTETKTQILSIDLSRQSGNEQLDSILRAPIFIPLETNDRCIVGSYDKVIVRDSMVFILDKMQQTVFCFSRSGAFQNAIAKQGNSGQEYVSAEDLCLEGDSLIVFDGAKAQLQYYNLAGEYLKTQPVTQGEQCIFNAQHQALIFSSSAPEQALHAFDVQGDSAGSWLPQDPKVQQLPSSFCNNQSLSRYQNEILITRYFDNAIYALQHDALTVKYRCDFGSDNMSADLLTATNDPASWMHKITQDKSVQHLDYFTETDDWIVFEALYPIYIHKPHLHYYVFNHLTAPYSLFFSNAPIGNTDDQEYILPVEVSQLQALRPALQALLPKYPFLQPLQDAELHEGQNNWLLLYSLVTE